MDMEEKKNNNSVRAKGRVGKVIEYLNKIDTTHGIIAILLFLYLYMVANAIYYNNHYYITVITFFAIIALTVATYIGHKSRISPTLFLGRPLTNKREIALRDHILNIYSLQKSGEDNTSPKSLAMLTAVLHKNGFLLQHSALKQKVAALFKELGRENEMEKYQSINRYLNKDLKFVNPNDKDENTDDLESIFNNILNF